MMYYIYNTCMYYVMCIYFCCSSDSVTADFRNYFTFTVLEEEKTPPKNNNTKKHLNNPSISEFCQILILKTDS